MNPTLFQKLKYLDDALRLLKERLSIPLPDSLTCSDPDYVALELSWFQADLHHALSSLLARTAYILTITSSHYLPISTQTLSPASIPEWRDILNSKRHLLSHDDLPLLDSLLSSLLKLVNLNLSDEECLAKWAKLRQTASLHPITLRECYTPLDQEFDEEFADCPKPSDIDLCRFVISHPAPHLDVISFVQKHLTHTSSQPKTELPFVTDTFRYKWFDSHIDILNSLYARLLKLQWIDKETTFDDFSIIFSGNKSTVKIIWTGTRQHLSYLISQLIASGFVSAPNSKMHWTVARSHFFSPDGQSFDDLRNQHTPKQEKNTIDRLVSDLQAPSLTLNP